MTEKEIQQLIDGCLSNDRQSQRLLYQKLYGYAMKICLRYAGNTGEAAEIVNDGFFKAFTNIEKYNRDYPFRAWLSKIMYNVSVDYYRSNLRWSRMEGLEKAIHPAHEITAERKLEYEDLLSYVQRLPPAYRLVFNLYAIDGYSHEEIARMAGISESTSRSNLTKARQKLRQMLSEPSLVRIMLLIWTFRRGRILPAENDEYLKSGYE
jgi:RNA polymerase sigma-70 factor (ECF subfamily)